MWKCTTSGLTLSRAFSKLPAARKSFTTPYCESWLYIIGIFARGVSPRVDVVITFLGTGSAVSGVLQKNQTWLPACSRRVPTRQASRSDPPHTLCSRGR